MKEADIYPPIQKYLKANGYSVYSEVVNCDITAKKGDAFIIVEMKKIFSMKLLYQAVARQELTDTVYIALPAPIDKERPPNHKAMFKLLKRLELGLILVHFRKVKTEVEVVFHPDIHNRRKNRRKQRAVLREMDGRFKDFNTGGSDSKTEKITAYKENVIQIAVFLNNLKKASPAQLRKLGTGKKTGSILLKDFFGWFQRVDKGIYELHPNGKKSLDNYPEHVNYFEKQFHKLKRSQ